MSQSELDRPDVARVGRRELVTARRIRHDARDGLVAAALSLGASVLVVVAARVALWWLG